MFQLGELRGKALGTAFQKSRATCNGASCLFFDFCSSSDWAVGVQSVGQVKCKPAPLERKRMQSMPIRVALVM